MCQDVAKPAEKRKVGSEEIGGRVKDPHFMPLLS